MSEMRPIIHHWVTDWVEMQSPCRERSVKACAPSARGAIQAGRADHKCETYLQSRLPAGFMVVKLSTLEY